MGWIGSVRCEKIRTWIRGTNFCINCTSSHRFALSFMQLRNHNKCTQTLWNLRKQEFRVQWGGLGVFLRKTPTWLRATNFALIAPVYPVLHRISCSYKTIINAPKHYATHENMSLGSNRVDWVRSLRKISTWLRGTSLCINCTSSHYFASSFMQLRNDNKCTQTLCNAPTHECRVQWSGLGVFVTKNSDVTSWHELVHWLHQFTLLCIEFHAVLKRLQMHPNTMQHTKTWA